MFSIVFFYSMCRVITNRCIFTLVFAFLSFKDFEQFRDRSNELDFSKLIIANACVQRITIARAIVQDWETYN